MSGVLPERGQLTRFGFSSGISDRAETEIQRPGEFKKD
jgi:hypothetical protein